MNLPDDRSPGPKSLIDLFSPLRCHIGIPHTLAVDQCLAKIQHEWRPNGCHLQHEQVAVEIEQYRHEVATYLMNPLVGQSLISGKFLLKQITPSVDLDRRITTGGKDDAVCTGTQDFDYHVVSTEVAIGAVSGVVVE